MAVAPGVMRSNATESVSVALFSLGRPASGNVKLALLSNGVPVARTDGFIEGQGSLEVRVPALADGVYELTVEGPGFSASQELVVESRTILFPRDRQARLQARADGPNPRPACSIQS